MEVSVTGDESMWVKKASATKAAMVLLLLYLGTAIILAQTDLETQRRIVQTPPPAITFSDWREIDSDEFTKIFDINFPSAVSSKYPENDTVRVRALLPSDISRPIPCVVILHYWGATDLTLETELARNLNNLGIGGVILTLPYHLGRTPKGSKSGELALQPDTEQLKSMMIQSVQDVRRTVDWIQTRPEFDHEKIGISGTSLGGIVSALGYGIEPRFKCGSFVLAGVNLARILWSSTKAISQREVLRRKGYSEEKLRSELRSIEPAEYLQPNLERKTLVIGARLDTVVPPACTQALANALKDENPIWMDTGHYGGAFVRGRIVRTVAEFFDESFRGRKFEAPPTINSLTLRFGLVYSQERSLQVAVSTDIWRLNSKGNQFASLMLTPQGFQGFLGQKVTQSLSIGVVLLPKRSGFGFNWNVAF